MLALAEARLGDFASATARLATHRSQLQARARVAIWSDDPDAFNTYATLTAREYRYGVG